MKKTHEIGIIGCGWLGFPLAKYWIANGFQVAGTTTQNAKLPVLRNAGIAAYLVQLGSSDVQEKLAPFLSCHTLVIAVPPKRRQHPPESYLREMKLLADAAVSSGVEQLIYISSTSAYRNENGVVDEDSAVDPGSLMVQTENLFPAEQTAIIRFGGLMGPERHPGRFFRGKKDAPGGRAPVNMIHLDDCIGMIDFVRKNRMNGIFNGVAPSHPEKQVFYPEASRRYQAGEEATFSNEPGEWKQVEPKRILEAGYVFTHPDLMESLQKTIW